MRRRRDRLMFPAVGVTRQDLVAYYARVAEAMLPHLQDRAVTVRRWPRGVDGPAFYQRHPQDPHGQPRPEAIRIEGISALLDWVEHSAVEFHVPLGRLSDPGRHDWVVLDLDPQPPADFAATVRIGRRVAHLLSVLRIPYLVKTSGGDGLHLYLPTVPTDARRALEQAERIARLIEVTWPAETTVARAKARRGPKVYVDYLQNGLHRTMAAPYTVRGEPAATVSWPVTWPALVYAGPDAFTVPRLMAAPVTPFDRPDPVDLGRRLDEAGIPDVERLRRIRPVQPSSADEESRRQTVDGDRPDQSETKQETTREEARDAERL